MTTATAPRWFRDLWSDDCKSQNAAFSAVMEATAHPVGWAEEVWEEVVDNPSHPDNHNRAIASQVLCNLAAHDSNGRVIVDLDRLVAVTRDARFVTARHCLQSLWRVGLAGPSQRRAIVDALEGRFRDYRGEELDAHPQRHHPRAATSRRRH